MVERRRSTPLRWTLCSAALLLTVASVRSAHGQPGDRRSPTTDTFLQRQQVIEQRARDALDRELPTADRISLDVGGWFDFYWLMFDDGVISSRTLRQYNFRVFGGLTLDRGVHQAYARMRGTYFDWNQGDNGSAFEDDFDGANLERGWYQLDVRKALKEYGREDLPFDLRLKLGRDFVTAGTGFTLALPLDHVQIATEWANFETTFLVGTTPKSTDNIDRSPAVDDQSERDFWMLQERYTGFQDHQPFVYWIYQRDRTEEDPVDLLQNYKYHSQYVGWGSTGQLAQNLRYSTEWILERGTSYGDRRFLHTDDIKAWAFDQLLEYYFKHKTQPRVTLEYMFASGDPDRLFSPTNAAGGNRGDDTDESFVGFGFRDTGLSFAPRLSNIHIWRLGGAFKPLPDVDALRDLELGTDWFLYHKHRTDAAVSDGTADEAEGFLGWEMDYFANYRITNDLAWTIRFGAFFPDAAFSDQSNRTFLLTGVTWSF